LFIDIAQGGDFNPRQPQVRSKLTATAEAEANHSRTYSFVGAENSARARAIPE
jgi:hypothetical protein